MRKKVMIGSALICGLLMLLPIAAAGYPNTLDTDQVHQKCVTEQEIIHIFTKKFENNPSEPTPIIVTLLIWFLKLIRLGIVGTWTAILGIIFYFIFKRNQNNTTIL